MDLQTYPKEIGKVNGIKCIVTNIIRSVCVLSPGVLWNKTEECLWYSIAAIIGIMVFIEIFYTILVNGTTKHVSLRQQGEENQKSQQVPRA